MPKAQPEYRVRPCYFKKSCGYDYCQLDSCPEYRPKKRGESYYGDEKEESEAATK